LIWGYSLDMKPPRESHEPKLSTDSVRGFRIYGGVGSSRGGVPFYFALHPQEGKTMNKKCWIRQVSQRRGGNRRISVVVCSGQQTDSGASEHHSRCNQEGFQGGRALRNDTGDSKTDALQTGRGATACDVSDCPADPKVEDLSCDDVVRYPGNP